MDQTPRTSASTMEAGGMWRSTATVPSQTITFENRGNLHPVSERATPPHSGPGTNIGLVHLPERQTINMPSREGVSEFYPVLSSNSRPSPMPATSQESPPQTQSIDEWCASLIPPGLLQPLYSSPENNDYENFMCGAMKTFTTPYLDFAAASPPEANSHISWSSLTTHRDGVQAQPPYADSVANPGAMNPGSYYRTPPATTAEHFGGFATLPPTGFAPAERTSSVRRTLTEIRPTENRAVASSPCASAGKCTKKESHEMGKKAQELAAASEMAAVQCSWNGCAEIIQLATLAAHLRTTHGVEFSERKKEKVRCLWSRGQPCKSEILAKSLRPHVRSHAKNVLVVKCPTCAQDFASTDILENHLSGNQ